MTGRTTGPIPFIKFGLLVTGDCEQVHLPEMFRILMATRRCRFEVIGKIGQRNPRSNQRQLKMVGSGKKIPDKDAEQIGLPARKYLNALPSNRVLLIDDLEAGRRNMWREVFTRYRLALETMNEGKSDRFAVFFLVNMLEAYFFCDPELLNRLLKPRRKFAMICGDAEELIVHPKKELQSRVKRYRELLHGGALLREMDLFQVLGRLDTCGSLRALFAWCVKTLDLVPGIDIHDLRKRLRLHDGIVNIITGPQLKWLPEVRQREP